MKKKREEAIKSYDPAGGCKNLREKSTLPSAGWLQVQLPVSILVIRG